MMLALVSYVAAAVAYALLFLMLVASRKTTAGRGHWLLAAAGAAMLWGLAIAVLTEREGPAAPASYVADALRGLVWTLSLLAALPRESTPRSSRRVLALSAWLLAGVAIAAPLVLDRITGAHVALLGLAVVGCLAVEQIFRNSTAEQQRILKPFLWTVAVVLVYDLFVFSDAALFGAVDPNLWALRGLVAALAVPAFLLSAKRQPDWAETLFISRHVVFYSATLTGVGVYLIAMALVAAVIRDKGGEWGALVQLAFFAAALGVLAVILSSRRLRAAARVFISKHFFRHQYEYRDEWLRLIRTLSGPALDLPLEQRSIKALATIIGSPGGQLWLHHAPGLPFEPFAAWQAPFPRGEHAADSPLVRFLDEQHWIIDSEEYEQDPERYNHAFRDESAKLPEASIIVPLIHQKELLGFVRLIRPPQLGGLNYEDHDLLKTAGRQVAAFLAHDLATEALAETRQFEAFSKLSAFVMHDLKNLLAQQALLVKNAKKHQHRPEFIADVIETVEHGVQRMRRLLGQLEQRSASSREQPIELGGLLEQTVAACAGNAAAPVTFAAHAPLWVQAPLDRLTSVLTHVIVNAQQATRNAGSVEVSLRVEDGTAVVDVCDRGEGMSEEFIRKRLFKPFDTTKGNAGMGIGAHQAREIVRALGGELVVTSEVGVGTVVRITLPLAPAGPGERALKSAAG